VAAAFGKHEKMPLEAFPYGIVYKTAREEIFIIAVMNLSREPDYWKDRAKKA
jgi:hypothetical protein